jgi:hypothetical protein
MRTQVDEGTLAVLVGEQLQVRISAGDMFTAYNITQHLRHKHPLHNIAHSTVRAMVHYYMNDLVHAGRYETARRVFRGKTAVLYQPASPAHHGGIQGVPLLPLN